MCDILFFHHPPHLCPSPDSCFSTMFSTHSDTVRPLFSKDVFSMIIADEAHSIKNHSTSCSNAMRYISHCSPFATKLALTGTLYVNKIEDIWSVSSFLMVSQWNNRICYKNKEAATVSTLESNRTHWNNMKSGFIVHRTLGWLAANNGLAAPTRYLGSIHLTGQQRATYTKFFVGISEFLSQHRHEWSAKEYTRHVLTRMSTLEAISDHPFLLCLQNKAMAEVLKDSEGTLCGKPSTLFMPCREPSDKMRAILKILETIRASNPNAKVVCFARRVRFIHILSNFLWHKGFVNLPVIGSGGGVTSEHVERSTLDVKMGMTAQDRTSNIAFWGGHSSMCVLLANSQCAGVGLNMYQGTHVIHVNSYMNEAEMLQAEMRVWRSNAKDVDQSRERTSKIVIYRMAVRSVSQK